MSTRERALRALREAGCSREVIRHCSAVERVALKLARKIQKNEHRVNLKLVSLGALLHDIGRAKTHGIRHGVDGAKILQGMGLGSFAGFAERHLGAGIPAGEAGALGLPPRDLMPRSLEEKIVTYADKLLVGSWSADYERALEWFRSELGPKHPAIDRFKRLHTEIQGLASVKK